MTFHWLETQALELAHEEHIAEHGGPGGLRDRALLESTLARPRNLAAHGTLDIAVLAAAYAYGIARKHPFLDGNKRTAAVAMEGFLLLNGHALDASDAELVVAMLAIAERQWSETDLAAWIRRHLVPAA